MFVCMIQKNKIQGTLCVCICKVCELLLLFAAKLNAVPRVYTHQL